MGNPFEKAGSVRPVRTVDASEAYPEKIQRPKETADSSMKKLIAEMRSFRDSRKIAGTTDDTQPSIQKAKELATQALLLNDLVDFDYLLNDKTISFLSEDDVLSLLDKAIEKNRGEFVSKILESKNKEGTDRLTFHPVRKNKRAEPPIRQTSYLEVLSEQSSQEIVLAILKKVSLTKTIFHNEVLAKLFSKKYQLLSDENKEKITHLLETEFSIQVKLINAQAKDGYLLEAENSIKKLYQLPLRKDQIETLQDLATFCENLKPAANFLKEYRGYTQHESSDSDTPDIRLLRCAITEKIKSEKENTISKATSGEKANTSSFSFPSKVESIEPLIALATKKASTDVKDFCKTDEQKKSLLLEKFNEVGKVAAKCLTLKKPDTQNSHLLAELDALKAQLETREKLYAIRQENKHEYTGIPFSWMRNSEQSSAGAKLAETKLMIAEVDRLKNILINPNEETTASWSPAKAARDGIAFKSELTKLAEKLSELRDSIGNTTPRNRAIK